MDERPAPERLPWEGLIGGLAGCLAVAILSAGIVAYYLAPKFRKATANLNFSANVSVTPVPAATSASPLASPQTKSASPDPVAVIPVAQPTPPPPPRPDWNATNPAPVDQLLVTQVKRQDGAVLFVENRTPCPITMTIQLEDRVNVVSKPRFPYTTTVAGHQKSKLATLSVIHPGRWSYRYNYRYSEGSQSAHHDPTHVYALPYETDESFPVTVIKGQEYHFEMPEDTPVLAAREGVVVAAEKRYSRNGMSDDFYRKVNRVLIRHHDGTLGAYYHLRPGGVVVELGDRVEVGDLLGYSGKTGHTEIPQLAFCVVKARDGNSQQYFPLRFATSQSARGTVLRSGMRYQGPDDDPYQF